MPPREPELPEELNAFEEERRLRVQRNHQVLQDLGLLHNPISGTAEAQQRAVAAERRREEGAARRRQRQAANDGSEQREPQRRSTRLRGGAVENSGMGMENIPSSRQQAQCRSSSWQRVHVKLEEAALEGGGDPSLDAHNIMRVQSMSERALQTRIWKIQRADKLHSFIRVLQACGKAELAGEAREALHHMCGGKAELAGEAREALHHMCGAGGGAVPDLGLNGGLGAAATGSLKQEGV